MNKRDLEKIADIDSLAVWDLLIIYSGFHAVAADVVSISSQEPNRREAAFQMGDNPLRMQSRLLLTWRINRILFLLGRQIPNDVSDWVKESAAHLFSKSGSDGDVIFKKLAAALFFFVYNGNVKSVERVENLRRLKKLISGQSETVYSGGQLKAECHSLVGDLLDMDRGEVENLSRVLDGVDIEKPVIGRHTAQVKAEGQGALAAKPLPMVAPVKWKDRVDKSQNLPDFVGETYGQWLGESAQLTRSHLNKLDRSAYEMLRAYEGEHGKEATESIGFATRKATTEQEKRDFRSGIRPKNHADHNRIATAVSREGDHKNR